MTDPAALAAGPWGPVLAIAGMALMTFLCRIAGAVVMSRVAITPRMERGLRALPGSIILATILPMTVDSGPPAFVAIAAGVVTMALTRAELAGLAAGLGTLSLVRALGF
ncbi:AzlD family protein [Microvirga thermotolerans]|uniref:AzlD domain-containing protein n=1 Tax=Microvirga thermotolerans TaxID=2651334 RepID=A0A5P9JW29_9HYPH|nr:AzlD domain-containing protein [Microvirga thermotolerans]QFU15640.1 AzlD domain-containing protein [Microvirga thermotolerans]